ncbi:MAG: peptidoglycan-binding domain-containing protein [Gaiellaceae bacterium]
MRRGEGDEPREDDWLAQEDWLEAPTQETPPSAPRRRLAQPPPGTPSRRLLALVAGVSLLLIIILIAIFSGDDDPAEQATPTTTPTETASAPAPEAPPELQIPESGTLAEGDTGPRVRRLQRALAELGYDVTPDGAFGPGTTAAVRAFQADAGLPDDGVAGPETARAVNEALAEGQ